MATGITDALMGQTPGRGPTEEWTMKRWSLAALAALTGSLLVAQPAWAQMPTQHDDAFMADMQVVHQLLSAYQAITRTVTKLPNGVRTVTESADPGVAAYNPRHLPAV